MLDFGFYNMDNMVGMKEFPDKYFQLAICDPPYGINIEDIWGDEKNGYKQYKKGGWDKAIPEKEYFDELFRVSQNQIIWGGNYFTQYLKGSMGWVFWDKGQRNFTCSDGELAYTSFEKALRVFTYSRSLANFSDTKIHINQKPVALYTWLLNNYAKKGDKILDTHVGSASSLIACHNLCFKYVGFELNKDYFDMANKRLERVKAQVSMFE